MTAISGRRMAETVARRGGLAVLPQDIPVDVVSEVVSWIKSRHPVYDTPITLSPTSTVGEALALLHKRAHGIVVVVEDGVPVGVVTDGAVPGRRPLHPALRRSWRRDPLTIPAGTDLPKIFDVLSEARVSAAPGRRGRPAGRRDHPQGRAALGALHAGGQRATGSLLTSAAVGINGDVAGKAGGPARRRRRRARRRHRARPPGEGDRGAARGAVGGRVGAGRGRQRGDRRGHARPDRGRRRRRQGRRRAGRDVHHADDDRRRAAAVLRRRGVRRRPPARSASTSGPTAACGTRATSRWRWPRGGERDGRLVVRRHLRERRRHPRRRPGRLYKESFGMASARAVKARTATAVGLRAGAGRRCSRRASAPRGCTSTRRARASRT